MIPVTRMQVQFRLILGAWLVLSGSVRQIQAEPVFKTRQAFAAHKRVNKLITPDSFKLDPLLGKDLKIEVWATSSLLFSPSRWTWMSRGGCG